MKPIKTNTFAATLLIAGSLFSGISQAAIHTIDLLILHPPKSVLNKDIPAVAASMESYANKALENSQANIQFRIVGIEEIDIANPKTDGTTLAVLRTNTKARELRAKYGADLVTMITPTGPYCGVGYVLGGSNDKLGSYTKNYGYNVVADRCVSSFAHELGHNLGLGHSFKQGSRGGLYEYGRGHGVQNNFVTTMAYTSAYSARRLQFFSNPEVIQCNGLSCGSAIEQNDSAHATRAVGVSGPQISNFFETVEPTTTTPPTVTPPSNKAPNAVDDLAVTRESEAIDIDVVKNDVDPDQDTLTLNSVGAAKHGATSIAGGMVHYIPDSDFIGQDNFQYTISDGHDHQVNATVTINVGWGVNYQYFQGQWGQLPDFESMTPTTEGIAHNFTLEPRLQNNYFGFRYIAQLDVPVDGNYRFYITSDDGSQLLIDGNIVVNNDGLHGSLTRAGIINLTSGLHTVDLRYFERTGGERLIVEWQGPGLTRQRIASSALRLAEPTTPVITNSFPVAGDDKIGTAQNTEISIDVLKNDTDTDGDTLEIISHSSADNGLVSLSNKQLVYQPDAGFTGSDSFSYQISDGRGGEDTGLVTVKVGQGMVYDYYEGHWNRLPDFDTLTPIRSGFQENFTLQNRERNNYFAFRFRAGLEVPRTGYYYFYLNSDDGSKLFIDGKLVVNNGGLHSRRWRRGRIKLSSGVHNIEVQYFEKTGRERLSVYWRGPALRTQKLTSKYLQSPDL